MPQLVTLEKAGSVATITLNRPEKYNSLNSELVAQLGAAALEVGQDEAMRAVVLTGADPAFCAGVDLDEIARGDGFGRQALDPLRDLPIPIVGAINGVAITGGLELALLCDFRIAGEKARFADTHARVGVVPAWGLTARLPQAIGQSWARQMSFTGDFVDAATALRIGLVNEVVPHERVVARAVELATSVGDTAPGTLRRIREIYDLGRDGSGADALAAEIETSGASLALEDPEGFARRRAAVFDRGRQQ